MKRFLVPRIPASPGQRIALPENESHHALHVFRLREGDAVEAVDGKGGYFKARIRIQRQAKEAIVWLERAEDPAQPSVDPLQALVPVTLELAILKGEAMEWAIEKAVELGVLRFQPVVTDHTVVQIAKKGSERFRERWIKIAEQALKQSERLHAMEVSEPIELQALLSRPLGESEARFWGAEREEGAPSLLSALQGRSKTASVRLLIGPEGGWSAQEKLLLRREKAQSVNLGPLILRAETAALSACSVLGAWHRS